MKHHRFTTLLGSLVIILSTVAACGGQTDTVTETELGNSTTPTPSIMPSPTVVPTPTPQIDVCGDNWVGLFVSGLAESDEIEFNWNLGWNNGFTGKIGNGSMGQWFAYCGVLEEFPPLSFEVIETNGYVCDIDDSKPQLRIIVECSPQTDLPPDQCDTVSTDLSVSGLAETDQIEIIWNPLWEGSYIGSIGNSGIENQVFSFCGSDSNTPELSFDIVNSAGYVCYIDESNSEVAIIVSCSSEPDGHEACDEGYSFFDGECRTPFGCIAPQFELSTTSGEPPVIDPITGEGVPNETVKSCVDSCIHPYYGITSPGQCIAFLP